ncbi:MAG: hypothetical protein RR341_08170 [Bacteroidales bacterium]
MSEYISNIIKSMGGILAAMIGGIENTVPLIIVCTIAIFFDCYTAWSLSRRVKLKYAASDGKFKSSYFGKVFCTLIKVYALIILAYLIDKHVLVDIQIHLDNMVAGAVCFWQIWSMLENESSCNNAHWAKVAQKVLVDKTERHFDIDLSELKKKNDTKSR